LAGRLAARKMAELLDGKGKVALVLHRPDGSVRRVLLTASGGPFRPVPPRGRGFPPAALSLSLAVIGRPRRSRSCLFFRGHEIERRGLSIAVIGVPKTVDNDVAFVDKTFGFDTAVELARLAVDAAHTEAIGARNGVGIVKLMGRDSGFIAAAAALASRDVNYCLLPEVHYDLDGPDGLFAELERRLASRAHALIVVAEGCGPNMGLHPPEHAARDASGNVRYGGAGDVDIGPRLRDAISSHFAGSGREVTVKYIDPSYMIRSVPANAQDSIFCDALARNAVHAGMAGRTGIIVGRTHRIFTHVPLSVVTSQRKRIDPDGDLWLAVTETTGQPPLRARGTSRSSEYPAVRID